MTRPPRNALLLIDVEPDERIMGDCNTWSGTHSAMALLDGVRAELETRTRQPVAFNWIIRMDPQVEKSGDAPIGLLTRSPAYWQPSRTMATTPASMFTYGNGTKNVSNGTASSMTSPGSNSDCAYR